MSIRELSPSPPREVTFQDALLAGPGEARRRILMQIGEQEKRRSVQLKAMSRATLCPRPIKVTREPTMKRADGLTL
jgi:hypothetical protein